MAAMNKKQIMQGFLDMLESGKTASQEDLASVLGDKDFKKYSQLVENGKQSPSEILMQFGKELEADMSSKNPEMFIYMAAINAKEDKHPIDYTPLIRTIKKKFMMDPDQFGDIHTNVIKTRDSLFTDKEHDAKNELDASVNKFDTRREIRMAERLDMAFDVYNKSKEKISLGNDAPEIAVVQQRAVDFMETVLNVKGDEKIQAAMAERLKNREFDPNFIPGRKPQNLTQLPDTHASIPDINESTGKETNKKAVYNWRKLSNAALAYQRGQIAIVRQEGLESDIELNSVMLKAHEHEKFQVIISNGKFLNREADNSFTPVDTSLRISHAKLEFAAYVVNLNGEMLLFDHLDQADKYAHSSMNNQAPLLCSGEVKIVNGELEMITTHSGHYKPTEQNVFNMLKYFKEQGVDISNVTVFLWKESTGLKAIDTPLPDNTEVLGDKFRYNAEEIYNKWKNIPMESVDHGGVAIPDAFPGASTSKIVTYLQNIDVNPSLQTINEATENSDSIEDELGEVSSYKAPNVDKQSTVENDLRESAGLKL